MKITEEVAVEVAVFRSPMDGALAVQIDTQEGDYNRLRVFLNDATLYSGHPDRDGNAEEVLAQIEAEVARTNAFENYPTNEAGDAALRSFIVRLLSDRARKGVRT